MRRFSCSATVLACLAVTTLGQSADAALVLYRVDYNPQVQATTLYNHPTSEQPLMFRTLVGANAGVEYALLAGESVTINADGTTGPGWLERLWDLLFGRPVNKEDGSTYTVEAKYTDCTVTLTNADGTTTTVTVEQGNSYVVPRCIKFKVKGSHFLRGCEIDATAFGVNDVVSEVGAASWGGDPTQGEMKFFGGSIWSTNDSAEFLTICTPQMATGCPEPGAALPLVGGSMMLVRRRRQPAN